MARKINEIQQIILNKKATAGSLQALEVLTENEKQNIDSLTSTSRVSVWRLFVYIVAVVIWSLEQIFDIFKSEIDEKVAQAKVHNFDWYINEAKAFQFGFGLVNGKYNNFGIPENALIASRIVKQVAIDSLDGKLQIKVVKEDANGVLEPLTPNEMGAFSQYMEKRKDAGTRLIMFSRPADSIRLELDIYYDSQVFASDGSRLDGQNTEPIKQRIEQFTRDLEFNGELIIQKLEDALQAVEGVKIADLKVVQSKYASNNYANVAVRYTPDSGHFVFDFDNSIINYQDYNA